MEVDIIDKEGSIDDIIDQDGFMIHDQMFSYRELLQCLFLCSKTCYDSIVGIYVNAITITINKKDRKIIAIPVIYNKMYARKYAKHHDDTVVTMNAYIKHGSNTISLLLSSGYIIDNFHLREPYYDFLVSDDQSVVVLEAEDIESLSLASPELI